MIPEKHFEVLKFLKEKFSNQDLNWALTGSTSFAIQGLDFKPNDIDLQTDKASAYKIGQILTDHTVREVKFSSNGKIKSHFGKFKIQGLEVEVMGDLQKKYQGEWTSAPDIQKNTKKAEYKGEKFPVFKLEYEIEGYRKIGRAEKSEKIRKNAEEAGLI